jgi:hypothetical protein
MHGRSCCAHHARATDVAYRRQRAIAARRAPERVELLGAPARSIKRQLLQPGVAIDDLRLLSGARLVPAHSFVTSVNTGTSAGETIPPTQTARNAQSLVANVCNNATPLVTAAGRLPVKAIRAFNHVSDLDCRTRFASATVPSTPKGFPDTFNVSIRAEVKPFASAAMQLSSRLHIDKSMAIARLRNGHNSTNRALASVTHR